MEMVNSHKRITATRSGFTDIFSREVGSSHPIGFVRRFSASETVVKNIGLYGTLEGHEGSVNAVGFNSTGVLLVSGSDDREVMFWNWESKTKLSAYPSGHSEAVFQTKFMPFTEDSRIVTSAGDGQVRLGLLQEDGGVITTMLGNHNGSVYNLAVEPGSPHILYSCGEDGFVQHFDLRTNSATKLFCCYKPVKNKYQRPTKIGLSSIVVDPRNSYYIAVGGSAEYASVYDLRKCQLDAAARRSDPAVHTFCPHHLIGSNDVHITGMAYSSVSELLVSYSDELIYLFEKNADSGSSPSSATSDDDRNKLNVPRSYAGHRNMTFKGVNFFGPNDEYVMSGSDCGHIFIWNKKEGKLVRLVGDEFVVNQLEAHPHKPILASCGTEKNVKIWAPLGSDLPPLPANVKEITEANRQGREDQSRRVKTTPDVMMHALLLHKRQILECRERRPNRADIVSDDDDEDVERYLLGFLEGDGSPEDDSSEDDSS